MESEKLLMKVLLELNQIFDITPESFDSGRFDENEQLYLQELLEEAEELEK